MWASEAIDVLSEASYACKGRGAEVDSEASAVTQACRHRVSALVDRGRFFFPNQHTDQYGTHKLPAFRGYRHAVLDPLVAAEHVMGGDLGTFRSYDSAIVSMRRHFVSRVHQVLSPESQNVQVAEMIRESDATRASDATLGGLLPDPARIPEGSDVLLDGGR